MPLNRGLVRGVAKSPDIEAADIQTMLAVNVTGLITLTQSVMKLYKTRPEGGRGDIINLGSIAGREGYPGGSIYCATKAAVRSFTEALRKETIDSRIRVMEIDPGQVETEFSVVRFGGDREKAKKVYDGCEPLTPEDIAEVIVFMAGRRENVVVADALVFPSHQVSFCGDVVVLGAGDDDDDGWLTLVLFRVRRLCCIGKVCECLLTYSPICMHSVGRDDTCLCVA